MLTDHDDPFSPPHAATPRVLVGRELQLARARRLIDRLQAGRFARGIAFHGVRGVGKTALLGRVASEATEAGLHCVTTQLSGFRGLGAAVLEGLPANRRSKRRVGRNATVKIRGSVPFAGLSVEYEKALDAHPDDAESAASRITALHEESLAPVLVIVDEADFLTDREEADTFLCGSLGRGSKHDLPISFVCAGTGYSFLEALKGTSTFVPWLTRTVDLPRLTGTESAELLTRTAARVGHAWTQDGVSPLVEVGRGIPRYLHRLGSELHRAVREGREVRRSASRIAARFEAQGRTSEPVPTDAGLELQRALADAGMGPGRDDGFYIEDVLAVASANAQSRLGVSRALAALDCLLLTGRLEMYNGRFQWL